MSKITDIKYNHKVNCAFSEAVFQKMASIRYGIDFCCIDNLEKRLIDKELFDINNTFIHGHFSLLR